MKLLSDKPWYQSVTVWSAGLTALAGVLLVLQDYHGLDPVYLQILVAIAGGLGIPLGIRRKFN